MEIKKIKKSLQSVTKELRNMFNLNSDLLKITMGAKQMERGEFTINTLAYNKKVSDNEEAITIEELIMNEYGQYAKCIECINSYEKGLKKDECNPYKWQRRYTFKIEE